MIIPENILTVPNVETPETIKPSLNEALPLSLIVTPVPIIIWLLVPSNVSELVPIVKIPVIRASPLTMSCVVPPPTTVLPNVETPETNTSPRTSSFDVGIVVPIPTELKV